MIGHLISGLYVSVHYISIFRKSRWSRTGQEIDLQQEQMGTPELSIYIIIIM